MRFPNLSRKPSGEGELGFHVLAPLRTRAGPLGGQTRSELRNDHLQYAITRYALAGALLLIYSPDHRRRGGDEAT